MSDFNFFKVKKAEKVVRYVCLYTEYLYFIQSAYIDIN